MVGQTKPGVLSSQDFCELRMREQAQLDDDLSTAKIFIVDDTRSARSLLAYYLRTAAFSNLVDLSDGQEALELLESQQPELIITDLVMPRVDGLELCRRLRANPNFRETPILVQTGSSDPNLRAEALESGATDLLTKPFDPRELISRTRILLERGRLINRLSAFQSFIAEELAQAAIVQESLLPDDKTIRNLEENCPVELAGHYEASVGLGGDIWGLDLIGQHRLLIFNADFTGHGLGAALNTVRLHSFIHGMHDKAQLPGILLKELNGFLCDVLPTGQYATMFCAVLDFQRQIIDYACAGAPPQLLRSGPNRKFQIIREPSFPLGITREAEYKTKSAPYCPGGTLLLFSDALIETPIPPKSAFTPESLCEYIHSLPDKIKPNELRDHLLAELSRRSPKKPDDDLTLIATKFKETVTS